MSKPIREPKATTAELSNLEARFKVLLMQYDPDITATVVSQIERLNLPFRVVQEGGLSVLKPLQSRGEQWLDKFITVDEDTILLKQDASSMAPTPYEVLITGPTGTGKELLAKAMIADRDGPFIAINCAGIPAELLEAELFGSVKGAYTSSISTTEGLFKTASNGVMFMDEIGELRIDLQAKLLRALQERSVRKVGATKEESINCKFVFATNRNIKDMVLHDTFRADLYARISALELDVKPLSQRLKDVVPITESLSNSGPFLEKYREQLIANKLDLSLNVRSLQKYVTQYSVLGRIKE